MGLQPTSQLLRVNDIDWFVEERSAGYVFSTVGRTATIEVAVPNDYKPETSALVDLGPAIAAADPVASPDSANRWPGT